MIWIVVCKFYEECKSRWSGTWIPWNETDATRDTRINRRATVFGRLNEESSVFTNCKMIFDVSFCYRSALLIRINRFTNIRVFSIKEKKIMKERITELNWNCIFTLLSTSEDLVELSFGSSITTPADTTADDVHTKCCTHTQFRSAPAQCLRYAAPRTIKSKHIPICARNEIYQLSHVLQAPRRINRFRCIARFVNAKQTH